MSLPIYTAYNNWELLLLNNFHNNFITITLYERQSANFVYVCVFLYQTKDLLLIEVVVNDGVYADVSWKYESITMVRKFTFLNPNMYLFPFR